MSDERRFLLVDLGGTRVRVAVANATGLLARREERTIVEEGPEVTERQIERMAREVLAEAGCTINSVERLAIGAPGPLDPATGTVHQAPNMPGWHEVHVAADLSALLGVPVVALNDANAAALGEFTFGAGRDQTHMVYLTVSTGIGAGVITDGRLLEGVSGSAGEVGHMSIDRHGPLCPCGNVGCLEMLASGTAIARRFRELVAAGATSPFVERMVGCSVTAADIAAAAAEGDPLASALFRDAADALGIGVVNCVHIFNPHLIVIGGGVTHAGALLFGPVEEMLNRHAMEIPRRDVRVVPAELGEDAGLLGCLARCLEY